MRWEDDHESIFTPGSDAVVRHIVRSKVVVKEATDA